MTNSLNWDNSKGSPYRIPKIHFHEGKLSWRILEENEIAGFKNANEKESDVISFMSSYYLYKIAGLREKQFLDLLGGFYNETYEDGTTESLWIDDFDDYHFYFLEDTAKPLQVFATYPFSKPLAIEIYPYGYTWVMDSKATHQAENQFSVGYILWQISRAYADIYENNWEHVGIWGHEFMDLAFNSIKFQSGNIALLNLDS